MKHSQGIEYGLCRVSICPIRKAADDRSEMVSQLLFGEIVEVFHRKGKNWSKILTMYDEYIGWVDSKQIVLISEKEAFSLKENSVHALEWVHSAVGDNQTLPVTAGSVLYNFDGLSSKSPLGRFQYSGQIINYKQIEITGDLIAKISKKYINAPYLWGGRTPFGIDCSGFTQIVFKMIGIYLPRDAYQQADEGRVVDFVEESQVGDLAYFVNKDNKVIHVGVILEDQMIIHASGWVRIDRLDHFGIQNTETGKYSHVLRFIKRLIPDDNTEVQIEKEIKELTQ